jgi:hypothetical protein
MVITNLAQLKKVLTKGAIIQVVEHKRHPGWSGQIRIVNIVKSNCVFVQLFNQPDQPFSKVNGGRGSRMDFDPAAHYAFDDPIAWYDRPESDPEKRLIMTFRIIESDCISLNGKDRNHG